MIIQEIKTYDETAILPLYESVGWTAYTKDPETLRLGFQNSLLALGAWEGETLLGLLRAVGDGHTVVLIQDLLVLPEHQRRGIGTALMKAALDRVSQVRQVQLLTDDTPKTRAFYRSLGLAELSELGCRGFMRP